jgi:hypothetical protein
MNKKLSLVKKIKLGINKNKLKRAIISILLIIIVLIKFIEVLVSLNIISKSEIAFNDLIGQWQICAYTLRGIDPYPLIGESSAAINEIGAIPSYWGTSPWGLILGNIGYAGFLSLESAKIYFVVLNIVLLLIVSALVFKKMNKITTKEYAIISVLITFSYIYHHSLFWGNIGNIISIMIIIAILYCNDNESISGVCLGIAMIKPQLALLVCLGFLIQKRFKPLVIAATMDIISWLIASIVTKTSMIELLIEFMQLRIGDEYRHNGIADILKYFTQLNDNVLLLISMILGITYVVIMMSCVSKRKYDDKTLFITVIASQFWCYSYGNDTFVTMIVAYLLIYMMYKSTDLRSKIAYAALIFIIYNIELKIATQPEVVLVPQLLLILLSFVIMKGLNEVFIKEKESEI